MTDCEYDTDPSGLTDYPKKCFCNKQIWPIYSSNCKVCQTEICKNCKRVKKCVKCLKLKDRIINFYEENLNHLTKNELLCLPRDIRKKIGKIIRQKIYLGKAPKALTYQLVDCKEISRIFKKKINFNKYKKFYEQLGYNIKIEVEKIK